MPGADVTPAAQVEHVVEGLRAALGPDLVGAYLFGSAALGGLRPHSDVDVMAVTRRPTTRGEKQRLVDHLLAVSGKPRHIELTIVVQSDVRPWRYPPRRDFQYGDWWRAEFERGELEPWTTETDPDLASLVTMVLRAGHTLVGPPAADVLDPVPRDDYVAALRACVQGVLADLENDTRNYVLTLARVWYSLATGGIEPKDSAAEWALRRLPPQHRPVLERARAIYLGEEDEHWDDLLPRVRAYADHVAREVDRVARAG